MKDTDSTFFSPWDNRLFSVINKNSIRPRPLRFIATRYNSKNIIADFKANKTVILNIKKYINRMRYTQTYVAILNRKIQDWQTEGLLGHRPTIVLIDEAPHFIPAQGVTSSRTVLMKTVDTYRRSGVRVMVAVQNKNDIDQKVFSQGNLLFFPPNADVLELIELAELKSFYQAHGSAQTMYTKDWWRKFTNKYLKNHTWLVMDNKFSLLQTFVPADPLSQHI